MSRIHPKAGFPPAVKEIYDALTQEVTYLHANWDTFKALYGTQESIDILNDVAPGAFNLIGYLFRHEFVIAAYRITDRKSSGKGKKERENLTLKQLLHCVAENCADPVFIKELEKLETEIEDHCETIRLHRNRVIAHLDLETSLIHPSVAMPDIESRTIQKLIVMLDSFMNKVLGHYTDAYHDFSPTFPGPGRNIIHGLKEFQRLSKEECQRMIAELKRESNGALGS